MLYVGDHKKSEVKQITVEKKRIGLEKGYIGIKTDQLTWKWVDFELVFNYLEKMTPSHQNSNCFHTWELNI